MSEPRTEHMMRNQRTNRRKTRECRSLEFRSTRTQDLLANDFHRMPSAFHDFFGTFAPFFRASDNPIAMACLRLFTLPPFPPLPDFNVPFFFRALHSSLVCWQPFRT